MTSKFVYTSDVAHYKLLTSFEVENVDDTRTVFQDAETDVKREGIYMNQRKCFTHTDSYRHDIAVDNKVAASSLKDEMVILCNEYDVEAEPVYMSVTAGLVGQTI